MLNRRIMNLEVEIAFITILPNLKFLNLKS
jgi:hypothetical protein